MEVKFQNHYPCISSWPSDFQFGSFFESCSEWIDMYFHSPFFLESVWLYPMCFIHSAFLLCSLGCQIGLQNCFVSSISCCWYVSIHSPLDGECFSLFWNVLFCLYFFIPSPYFDSFPSFAWIFGFISSSCIFCFTWGAFEFVTYSSVLSLSSFFVVDFLSAFLVEFPIQVLSFCSYSL